MKYLATLLLFFSSLTSFAQDTYHLETELDCHSGESCLINKKADFLIKTIPIVGHDGIVIGERLSSSSNLADTLHQKAEYCYKGEAHKICDILNLMAYDDGHAVITGFACQVVNAKVEVQYEVYYDMGPGLEQLVFLLAKCD